MKTKTTATFLFLFLVLIQPQQTRTIEPILVGTLGFITLSTIFKYGLPYFDQLAEETRNQDQEYQEQQKRAYIYAEWSKKDTQHIEKELKELILNVPLLDNYEVNKKTYTATIETLTPECELLQKELETLKKNIAEYSDSYSLPYIKNILHGTAVLAGGYIGFKTYQKFLAPFLTEEQLSIEQLIKKISELEHICAHDRAQQKTLTAQPNAQSKNIQLQLQALEQSLTQTRKEIELLNQQLSNPESIGNQSKFQKAIAVATQVITIASTAYLMHLMYKEFDTRYLPHYKHLSEQEKKELNKNKNLYKNKHQLHIEKMQQLKDTKNMLDKLKVQPKELHSINYIPHEAMERYKQLQDQKNRQKISNEYQKQDQKDNQDQLKQHYLGTLLGGLSKN